MIAGRWMAGTLLFAVFTMGWLGPALACSCAAMSPEEQVRSADLIFRGTVLSVEPRGGLDRFAQFHVRQLWKGPDRALIQVIYQEGTGANCGLHLKPNEIVIVFATWRAQENAYSANGCAQAIYQGNLQQGRSYDALLPGHR